MFASSRRRVATERGRRGRSERILHTQLLLLEFAYSSKTRNPARKWVSTAVERTGAQMLPAEFDRNLSETGKKTGPLEGPIFQQPCYLFDFKALRSGGSRSLEKHLRTLATQRTTCLKKISYRQSYRQPLWLAPLRNSRVHIHFTTHPTTEMG